MTIPLDAAGTALALMVLAHFVCDFALQTSTMVKKKATDTGTLLLHGAIVFLVTLIVLLPWWNIQVLVASIIIGATHIIVDKLKITGQAKTRPNVGWFLADQAAHLVIIWVVWLLLIGPTATLRSIPLVDHLLLDLRPVILVAIVASAYLFNIKGGTAIVRLVLSRFPDLPPPGDDNRDIAGMGRTIGNLERLIILTLVLVGQWAALGLVLAAKSILRIGDRPFVEYYLIGTFTSVVVAVASGLVVHWLVL